MSEGTYTRKAVEEILTKVAQRKISAKDACHKLRHLAYESLKFAQLDHHRSFRKNLPEVVYAPGKPDDKIRKIISRLVLKKAPLLVTRLNESSFRKLKKRFPKLKYSKEAAMAYSNGLQHSARKGSAAIVTAGTSDIPVAEEAALTLEVMGRKVNRIFDVGVAGLHRLLDHLGEIERADIVIVAAGMEGALPSVLAGLVSKPVIAVPTSVGYGASFRGLAPLLTMLSTCAQGVAVVNIDSGFNAACFAALLLDQIHPGPTRDRSRVSS